MTMAGQPLVLESSTYLEVIHIISYIYQHHGNNASFVLEESIRDPSLESNHQLGILGGAFGTAEHYSALQWKQ